MKRIYLEITNACNLNCPFCTNEKGNNYLSLEDIKSYLPQIKEYTDNIYLHVLGEPLLHPNINEIFEEAEKNNLNINIVTNGILLNKDILMYKSLRKLSISIHSINNILIDKRYYETLLDIIKDNNDKYIELRFYDEDNLSETNKDFLNKLKEDYPFEKTDRHNSYRLKNNVYVLFNELFKWPNIEDEIINKKGYCHGSIDQIAILSNKDVTICCLDPKAYNKIGNLKNNTLKEILDSKKYLDIKNNMKNHIISCELCKRCTYRSRFD